MSLIIKQVEVTRDLNTLGNEIRITLYMSDYLASKNPQLTKFINSFFTDHIIDINSKTLTRLAMILKMSGE